MRSPLLTESIVDALASVPVEVRLARNWDALAYCARYGRIDVDDWARSDALEFQKALGRIVEGENKKNPTGSLSED